MKRKTYHGLSHVGMRPRPVTAANETNAIFGIGRNLKAKGAVAIFSGEAFQIRFNRARRILTPIRDQNEKARSESGYHDCYFALIESKTGKPVKRIIMTCHEARERNRLLGGCGFMWARCGESTVLKKL